MIEPRIGQILLRADGRVRVTVNFADGPQGVEVLVVLPTVAYTLTEIQPAAIAAAYDFLSHVMAERPPAA